MKVSKELFVKLAKSMSTDDVIEKMEETINKYKEAKMLNNDVDEALEGLHIATHLFIMNSMEKSPDEIIKEMNKVDQRVKFFDTEKN
jgi:hypothetical protein